MLELPLGMLFFTAAVSGGVDEADLPFRDPSLPVEQRVADLVSRLRLEEKATLMFHTAPAIERLGVPEFNGWNQCLHGVVWSEPTTMFPNSIAMAATWNPELIHEVATVISDEARAIYNYWRANPQIEVRKNGLVYRAPVINISRDPRWGRIMECFGEDPYLTSRIGVAYVKGLQGDNPKCLKLVSTLKHYAVNNQETDRHSLSAEVGERWLMEYWLPHFKACIMEGQAQSIMAAYNAVNDVPCVVNELLLTEILKKQWGFEGFVVSDTGGIKRLVQSHHWTERYEEAVAKAVLAGCNLDDKEFMDYLPSAVREGLLPEKALDQALSRVLRARFRLGEFDPPDMVPYNNIPADLIGCRKHRELALRTARESIVLLRNKGGFLPLDRKEIQSIAVVGPHADIFTPGGYSGKPIEPVTPLDGLRNRAAKGTQILFSKGCDMTLTQGQESTILEAAEIARKADIAIVFAGTDRTVERESLDRVDLALPGAQEELLKAVCKANSRTVLVVINAGPLAIPWAKQHVPATLEAWYGGEAGANAVGDVLFGDYNPGGRMPLTVYESLDHLPPQTEYDISKGFTYMHFTGKPLFPFGHGLSYTSFAYRSLRIAPQKITADGRLTVSLDLKNTGKCEGDEVVQLYVRDLVSSVNRPIKQLLGFKRIHLKPGETTQVSFHLDAGDLSFYDVDKKQFVVEPGVFEACVGSSSEDIRLRGKFKVLAAGLK